jgi:DNA-binding beta-propeller fold protein YncE
MRMPICLTLVSLLAFAAAARAQRVIVVAGGGDSPADAAPKPATDVALVDPFAVDFDADGNMYIAELEGGRVLRVTSQGQLTRLAGRAEQGDEGDGGPVERAVFNGMHHLLIGPGGGLMIADSWNNRVRQIDLDAMTIRPLAGTGSKGFAGDDGPALEAQFGGIYCLALGPGGKTLYLADLDNRRIRAIDLATRRVRTIAGNGQRGVPEDGALAVEAPLVDPRAVAVDSAGNVYILERSGHALRVVDGEGRIRTVAGTGQAGHSGDDGPALKAQLNGPKHLCIDADDNVLIADTENHVIRRFWPAVGRITHVAGTGQEGAGGLDGPASQVQLSRPHGVIVGPDGHLYISDSGNGRVLRIEQ